jgi:hypothetical protein
VRGPGAAEAIRGAARVVADPAGIVRGWRALTGGKATGCCPPIPVPEILHAAGLLPVPLHTHGSPPGLSACIDAWVLDPRRPPPFPVAGSKPRFEFPATPPAGIVEALDLLEALSEWAGIVSGRPVTEGVLGKSILAFRERQEHLFLLRAVSAREPDSISPGDMESLRLAGDWLPPEAHVRILARSLCRPVPAAASAGEGERAGDPLLSLARRWAEGEEPRREPK